MVAITGANGLLGSRLVHRLAADSIPFYGVKRAQSDTSLIGTLPIEWREADLLDVGVLHDALKGATTVIHTAALVSFKSSDSEQLYRINVEGTRNIVNTCLGLGIQRMIHVSSVAALGRHKGVKNINENHLWVESRLNSDYAESKYLAELEVFRGREEGLEIDIINPSVILSQANWDRSSAQLFKYVWKNKPFYTEGAINYVDARDVVDMISLLLTKKASGERFIANGGAIALKDILSKIAIHFNKKAPWIKVPGPLITATAWVESARSMIAGDEPMVTPQSARGAQERFFYDNEKAIQKLGMEFRTIEDTLEWCCSYYLQNGTINNRN
ncbi:MAG: NAD-dependent epimerase/dehydratase family protein [Cyclobacteriaceae bacterium]|nr:NAD-dependent epimerase/dehydratase family protein [Cyclobacteriaceae bacterium]